MLRLGHKQKGRQHRVAAIQAQLAERLGWDESRFARLGWRLPDSYWLAEPIEVLEVNARLVDTADRAPAASRPPWPGLQPARRRTPVTRPPTAHPPPVPRAT